MKKLVLPILMLAFFSASAQVYQKGSKFVNVGVGLSPGLGVIGSIDLGIHESISAGVFAGYQTWGLLGNSVLNYGSIGLGGKADFHLAKVLKDANIGIDTEKIDPYIGASVGVSIYTGNYGSLLRKIRPIIGGRVGARYMFKPNLGFFGEVGYDVTYLKAGISMKLGK